MATTTATSVTHLVAVSTTLGCCIFQSESFWTTLKMKKKKKKLSLKLSGARPITALPFDLSPPPIDHDLLETVKSVGAEISDDGVIETFNNDDDALDALDAVDNGVVVVDLSNFGWIRVSGDDRIQFLHNQTTSNFENLSQGQSYGVIDGICSIEIHRDVTLFLFHQQHGQ